MLLSPDQYGERVLIIHYLKVRKIFLLEAGLEFNEKSTLSQAGVSSGALKQACAKINVDPRVLVSKIREMGIDPRAMTADVPLL